MSMLIFVSERQSGSQPLVFSPSDDEERNRRVIELLSQRLKHLMGVRGWGITDLVRAYWTANGKPLRKNGEPKFVRWQTVQAWVEGTLSEAPSYSQIEKIAAAFTMDVDELLGLAIGEEPTSDAWREFLAVAGKLSPEERREVARKSFADKNTAGSYMLLLAAYRARQTEKPD